MPGQLRAPEARGKLWNVSRGVYTDNLRGEPCVIKTFREKYDTENYGLMKIFAFNPVNQYYWKEGYRILKGSSLLFEIGDYNFINVHPASALAAAFTALWNQLGLSKKIRVQRTFILQNGNEKNNNSNKRIKAPSDADDDSIVKHVYVESYFDDYHIWNSNSGWNDSITPWGKVMQAVSHFSYHASYGKLLLCDLQGGFPKDAPPNTGAVIVSPAFCSAKNNLGIADLGMCGIHTFFSRHKCNEYCSKDWLRPKGNTEKGRKYSKIIKECKATTYWDFQMKKYI